MTPGTLLKTSLTFATVDSPDAESSANPPARLSHTIFLVMTATTMACLGLMGWLAFALG